MGDEVLRSVVTSPAVPIPESYWVEPGLLLAGEYPGSADPVEATRRLRAMLVAGVTDFVDLTQPGELEPYEEPLVKLAARGGVRYRRFPVPDFGVPRSGEVMNAILDVLEDAVANGRTAYVHCFGGVGRTGTAVGCWLVRQGRSGDEALRVLAARYGAMPKSRHRKPRSPETPEQEAWIRSWPAHDGVRSPRALSLRERYLGLMLGLAAGDALGTTLEFTDRRVVEPIDDMVGGGPFGLEPGQWTDDTSMALCLAESLVTKGFDGHDQMSRYVRWWKHGELSSTGRCFDIGTTTRAALARFERTGDPQSGDPSSARAGNGSLMRLGPVPLAYGADPSTAIDRAAESSRMTHAAPQAVDACRYFAHLIIRALAGHARVELLAPPPPGAFRPGLDAAVDRVAHGYYRRPEDQISASGYAIHTLEAVLWAFEAADGFRDGALRVVNLGQDADTTGCIYGQLAGAYWGHRAIPAAWRGRLALRETIESLAVRLLAMREGQAPRG